MFSKLRFWLTGARGQSDGEAAANENGVVADQRTSAFGGVAGLTGGELEPPALGFGVFNLDTNLFRYTGRIGEFVHQNLQPSRAIGVCRSESPMTSGAGVAVVVCRDSRDWSARTSGESESGGRPQEGTHEEKLEDSGGFRHRSFFIFERRVRLPFGWQRC